MTFIIECQDCKAKCSVPGSYDPSCNATELDEEVKWEWSRGEWPECEHDNFDVIDSEFDHYPDDVI